jgi:hypothetical protein
MALTQTISMPDLPAKTYGDAPFTVTATASSGLPITKWESSDPSVATISASGEVTVVGAGQTSIIASNSGDATYTAAWGAKPLNVALAPTPPPSGPQDVTVTYNGNAHGLDPTTLPSGLATEISYRDAAVPEPPSTPQAVFQNSPDTLDLSYLSTSLQAAGYWGMAKYVSLAGTARKLHSCDVTLVSWARYDTSSPYGYKSWADAHPDLVVPPPAVSVPGNSGGYSHPVTLAFYGYVNDGVTETYRLLTSKTVQAFIPWRPVKLADGVNNYTNSGYAFRVPFSFPDGVILPHEVWVGVSFNTNSFGIAPIGSTGPYDSLNIARPLTQTTIVGTALLTSYTLSYKNWRWQSGSGSAGPMLRLYAVPTNASLAAPVNAGSYEVKTQAAAFASDGISISTLVIDKAPLAIDLGDLTQVRDGSPKPVTVTTTPGGIATTVSYGVESSPDAPSALGSYPVTASSANPNYEGQATGTLQIGDNFASWQNASFASSGLPPEKTTGSADPDGDGLSNFLEYASNLNPLLGDQPSPAGYEHGATLGFTYRRNLHALDLEYSIQGSTDLADPQSWGPVVPLSETTVSDDGSTRVIRASVAKPVGETRYFLRLSCAKPQ